MKNLMTAFLIFLCIPFLISPINALEGGDINVNVSELLLSLEVTLSSDITINPNTLGSEESIISSSGLKVKNSSSMNVDVFAVDINSAYDNEFLEYSDDSIIWRNMGYEDTIEYIAFSIDNKDILPEEEVSLGTVFNKWDVENNEKTFNLNVKSGYAWKSTDILEREYPITLIFRIDEEDMSQHVDSSIQFIDFTSNKFGYSEVTIVCNGIKTIEERGFIYVKEGTEDIIYSISSDNSETYNSTFNDLEELSNYTVKAYVKADNNYYYSEETLYMLTPSIFKYEIDITGVSYTFKTTGGESFVVDWGDGVKEEYPGGNLTVSHMYSSNGIKTVEIKANKLNLSFSDKVIINVLSALPERTDSYMSSIFSGQTSLVSIPVELFYNNPQVTSFAYVFKGCSSLLEIPEELFKDCIGLTSSNPFLPSFHGLYFVRVSS